MTLQDIAERMDVAMQTVGKWEKNIVFLSEYRAIQLSKIFNIPKEYFGKKLTNDDKINILLLEIKRLAKS